MFLRINKVILNDFISHPRTEVSFDYGVTAIIGENGSGKTSIIDAVIVAFGGKEELRIRGTSKNLIRRGTSEARIAVEFSIGNRVYRIERIISKLRTDYTRVLYEVIDGKRKIIARGDKVTEELEKILGLKPSTINTIAILRQGRLYELLALFTSGKKKARQELIDELLGLDKYRKAYENMAKLMQIDITLPDGSKTTLSPTRTHIPNLRSYIETSVKRRRELENEIDKYEKELTEVNNIVNRLSNQLENIRNNLNILREKERVINEQIKQYEIIKNEHEKLLKEINDLEKNLKGLESKYKELSIKVKAYSKYQRLAELIMQLENNLLSLENMKKDYEKLKKDYNLLNERIMLEKQGIVDKINRYREVLEEIKELKWKRDILRDSINELKKKINAKRSEVFLLDQDIKKITEEIGVETYDMIEKQRIKLIKQLQSISVRLNDYRSKLKDLEKAGAKCPICGRELTPDHKMKLIKEFNDSVKKFTYEEKQLKKELEQIIKKLESIRLLEKKLMDKRSRLETLHTEIENLEKELSDKSNELDLTVRKLKELEKEYESLKKLDIENIEKHYNELSVKTREYNPDDLISLKKKLTELEDKIKELEQIVKDAFNVLAKETKLTIEKVFQNFNYLKNSIIDGKKKYEELSKELSKIEGILAITKSNIHDKRKRLELLEIKLKMYDPLKLYNEKEIIEKEIRKFENLEKKTSNELIEWSGKKKAIEEILIRDKDELKRIYEFLNKAIEAYKILSLAYYLRENVLNYEKAPAEIRKQAIKLLEKETSSILEQFELDYTAIRLTNDLGVEVYSSRGTAYTLSELSGGEQIAVILAIILGLHKIIGKGRLGVLALDEPTIYLDEERRKKLIEVIKNFRGGHIIPQLIVITHNREVVNASDQVYEVVKEPSGSKVSILETI